MKKIKLMIFFGILILSLHASEPESLEMQIDKLMTKIEHKTEELNSLYKKPHLLAEAKDFTQEQEILQNKAQIENVTDEIYTLLPLLSIYFITATQGTLKMQQAKLLTEMEWKIEELIALKKKPHFLSANWSGTYATEQKILQNQAKIKDARSEIDILIDRLKNTYIAVEDTSKGDKHSTE